MSSSRAIILISFAILWVTSLFAIALASPSTIEVDYDFGFVNSYINAIADIYHLIPSNVILVVAVISLLFVSRYLFKL